MLLKEYFTRVYKISLWKSYAEYNIFFSSLTDNEKDKLSDLLVTVSKKNDDVTPVDALQLSSKFGYFNEEWEKQLEAFGLKNVVWVTADSKLKGLNPHNTCIVFNEDTTLNYQMATGWSQDVQVERKMSFFYLFYEKVPHKKTDISGLKKFMVNELKRLLNERQPFT